MIARDVARRNVTSPFPLPAEMRPDLARVLAYWRGLLRGEATMPFWDDLRLSDLGDIADRAIAIEVFDKPQRFRLDVVGGDVERRAGGRLAGQFPDRIERPQAPLDYLLAQASATVEAATPTHYENAGEPGYARLVLPMWGDGRTGMLLAAIDWT